VPVCGEPVIDAATDRALFVWQDCVSGMWHARLSPGNTYTRYRGTVDSSLGFSSVVPFSLESTDVLGYVTGTAPATIDYDLRMGSGWLDGFDFSYPAESNVCIALNAPAGITALVGPGRTPVTVPFNPETLGLC
jgi:hypothetical protein